MIDITKKYMTRDGRAVELISDKGRGAWPVVGYVAHHSYLSAWHADGSSAPSNSCEDLISIKEKKTGWTNLFRLSAAAAAAVGTRRLPYATELIYATKEAAMQDILHPNSFIATIQIE